MSRALTLAALVLSSVFGIIGGSVGLNALIKSNRQKAFLKHSVHPPTKLYINTDDTLRSGIVIAVTCGLIGLISMTSLKLMLLPSFKALGDRTRKLRAYLLAFFTIWLLAALIPFTVFFATRSAIVSAYVGSQRVPQAAIEKAQKQLGATPVYKKIYFLRLLAVLPWFTFLFGAISAIAVYMSEPSAPTSRDGSLTSETMAEKSRMHDV